MHIIEADQLTGELWDQALLTRPNAHFLQSWGWYQFQLAQGNLVWPLAVIKDDKIISQLLVSKLLLPGGASLLYAARGHFINPELSLAEQEASQNILLARIRTLGQEHRSILFRIDPEVTGPTTLTIYRSMGFKHNPHKNTQPRHTQILNLDQPLSRIVQNFKPKTRYNIKLAERQGVRAELGQASDLSSFLQLTRVTAERDRFTPHADRYYQTQYQTLNPLNLQELFIARYKGEVIAGILVTFFGHRATYVHGASANHHRQLMAPHALQWLAIEHAHQRGLSEYDFGGTHPDPNHSWAGITRFKSGFGGTPVEYIGTLELPLHPLLFSLYQFINRLR